MKKKLLVLVAGMVFAFSLMACGEEEVSSTPVDEAPAADVSTSTSVGDVAAAATDDFTLLDVTTDMIEFGIYAQDEDGTENVISAFTGPDGTMYVAIISVNADGTGSAVAGPITDVAAETDQEGTEWSCYVFDDAYSGGSCTAVFADFADGSVIISNDDFSYAVAGEYLSQEETITFLGVAATFVE